MNTINALQHFASEHNDEALALEAAYIRTDYYLRGKENDVRKGLAMIAPLVDRARKQKLEHAEARILANFASVVCFVDNDIPKCLRTYLMALDIANRFPDREFPEKLSLLHHIAGLYYRFGENAKARYYAMLAIGKDDYQIPEYLYHRHSAINTIGLTYRSERKFDSAVLYFNRALQSLNTTKDSVWQGETWKAITKGNMGITYMMKGDYASAKPLLRDDVAFCTKAGEYDNALHSLLKLTEIALIEKDTQAAATDLVQARRLCAMARDTFVPLADIYHQLAGVAIWQNKKNLAIRYLDSFIVVKDSLMRKNSAIMVVREALYDQELAYKKDRELANVRHRREVWTRNGTIALLVLGSGIIIYLLNRRRKHHIAEKHILQRRKTIADKALGDAREELAAFTRTISEKNALIEKISAQLNTQNSEHQPTIFKGADTELLSQLQQSILLTDEQWEDFQGLFEQAHPGYLGRMHDKYTNLTPAEVRYVLLLKLRLSPKEMAAMLGISPSSIRIYRHRLRKKLQLSDDSNLEALAESI